MNRTEILATLSALLIMSGLIVVFACAPITPPSPPPPLHSTPQTVICRTCTPTPNPTPVPTPTPVPVPVPTPTSTAQVWQVDVGNLAPTDTAIAVAWIDTAGITHDFTVPVNHTTASAYFEVPYPQSYTYVPLPGRQWARLNQRVNVPPVVTPCRGGQKC